MKTKVDILASYSQFFGEYDTVVIDEIIENDETRVDGISIRLTRRRNPRSRPRIRRMGRGKGGNL